MFGDKVLERIFADDEMREIPIGAQATAISVIDKILDEIRKENPYDELSDILSADE